MDSVNQVQSQEKENLSTEQCKETTDHVDHLTAIGDNEESKTDSSRDEMRPNSSAYLWRGFTQDVKAITFDCFRQSRVKNIAFGAKHSLYLMEDGTVFTLGSNEFGQLGQGSLEVKVADTPVIVSGFPAPVEAIACGAYHSAVVTSDGQVLCWGQSKSGQCGTGSLDIVTLPTLVAVEINTGFCQHGVPNPAGLVVVTAVSCGTCHTLALSSDGEIWAWGAGAQLGLGELKHAPIPRRVDGLSGKTAVAVCCGDSHSLALVLSSRSKVTATPESSPVKTKKEVSEAAGDVKSLSTNCGVCTKDNYTFTEGVNDSVVVDVTCSPQKHPEGQGSEVVGDIDSTAVDDVFCGSYAQPANIDGGNVHTLHRDVVYDISPDPRSSEEDNRGKGGQLLSEKVEDSIADSAAPAEEETTQGEEDGGDELGVENIPINEMSTLSVGDESMLEESHLTSPISVSVCDVTSGETEAENNSASDSAAAAANSSKETSEEEKVGTVNFSNPQSPTSSETAPSQRPRSLSTASSGSLSFLNQSEAMHYLKKQFQDDDEEQAEAKSGTTTLGSSDSVDSGKRKDSKRNLTFDNVLGYPSSMMSQVKSMTTKAWTNIGTLSLFGSSGQLAEDKGKATVDKSGNPLIDSGGSSSLSSGLRESPDSGIITSNTSDSLAQWCLDVSVVDPDKEGDGEKSLRTIQMKQRNLSASRPSSTVLAEEARPAMMTATEVYVWGDNQRCQLGLGDQLERSLPVEVKAFRGRHVIKLAAGTYHTLALTANSQVFSWGSNAYGQLGQLEDLHSPMRIKMSKGGLAWDIAAGDFHSVVLTDSADRLPQVFYCGKQPSEVNHHVSNRKTSQFVSLAPINQMGWITGVMAGGEECACIVLNPPPPETKPMFELAASERGFYNRLIKTSNNLLRPLQKSDFYNSVDVYPYQPSLRNLVGAFGSFTKKVGEGITDLTQCVRGQVSVTSTRFVQLHDEFMQAFITYSQAFSDMMAVGGFEFCTRAESQFFEKTQAIYRDQSAADRKGRSDTGDTFFQRAMMYPFFRIADYVTLLDQIAQTLNDPVGSAIVQEISLKWAGLMKQLTAEHKIAKATKIFWTTTIGKTMVDSLCIPGRRVLRDSKTNPLQWPAGKTFSSKLFVLFNDMFVLSQGASLTTLPLETVWVLPGSAESEHLGLTVISPEDRFELVAPSPDQKAQWLATFNSSICKALSQLKSLATLSFHANEESCTPPLARHAPHKFVKSGPYKDAIYDGTWQSGKVDGQGSLKFEDGSLYEGHFKKGLMHGPGTYTLVRPGEVEVQKGSWTEGKLNGLATVSYSNGDLYIGYFRQGQRFGHGSYESGRHNRSSCSSHYVGEWHANLRDGYGVQDDILKGEKYMGMWADDQRHGRGVLVTLDGMYFEGNFVLNKLQGFGLMISDDNTVYEGDFMGTTHLSGKGTLSLPTGDRMEGSFSGSLNGGLKVNGVFHKSVTSPDSDRKHSGQQATAKSKNFGRLCVAADSKWTDIFSHATASLGQSQPSNSRSSQSGQQSGERAGQGSASGQSTERAWELVAVSVSVGKKNLQAEKSLSSNKVKVQVARLDDLEKIPSARRATKLDRETVEEIALYLTKSFDVVQHPLGRLMESVEEVFRASYIGVGAHPRLLPHAVQEIGSYVRRIYKCVRILFPCLPVEGGPLLVYPADSKVKDRRQSSWSDDDDVEDPNMLVLTSAGLIYPVLLPKIYPPLFDLYALYNERADDLYWERVTKLNRQSDMGLMAYLGLEQRFWLMEDILQRDPTQKLSSIKDVCYAEAVDILQQLSTAFSPIEKLKVIEETFNEITKTVGERVGSDVMWCMDDLFPIFQFVVVRAKLQHLGAEIHLTEDLMESHLEHGELGIMLTTLKACYFQIQNEKMPHH